MRGDREQVRCQDCQAICYWTKIGDEFRLTDINLALHVCDICPCCYEEEGMTNIYTYEGIDITDLLIECSKVENPRTRNEQLYDKMIERFGEKYVKRWSQPQCDLSHLYSLMDGMHFANRNTSNLRRALERALETLEVLVIDPNKHSVVLQVRAALEKTR